MRNIVYYLAGVAILYSMSFPVKADYIDLRGGEVVNQGVCGHSDRKAYNCIAVLKDNKLYNILFDETGEVAIYIVEGKKASLIWSKSSV
jgi:hypothetical protein